jgi:hypothetical protein
MRFYISLYISFSSSTITRVALAFALKNYNILKYRRYNYYVVRNYSSYIVVSFKEVYYSCTLANLYKLF